MQHKEEVAGADPKPFEEDPKKSDEEATARKAAEARGKGSRKKKVRKRRAAQMQKVGKNTTEYSFFIRKLYGELLETKDTFPIKLRKMGLAIAFFCSFFLPFWEPFTEPGFFRMT